MSDTAPNSKKNGFVDHWKTQIREELFAPKDTVWNNEVRANLFTARVMLGTALPVLAFILPAALGRLGDSSRTALWSLVPALLLMILPAALCIRSQGGKTWMKLLLLAAYVPALALAEAGLARNVALCLMIPLVLSLRYYSGVLTACTGLLTAVAFLLVSWITAVFHPENVTLTVFKTLMLLLITALCAVIAARGRVLIFGELEENKKAERLAMELNLAKTIQANMVPNIFPAFPDRREFDVFARMEPAKELGGDFFDFHMIDRDHLALIIADVSGKGIPAALIMMSSKSVISKLAKDKSRDPAKILRTANQEIMAANSSGMFVTMWLGILELSTGRLTASNAGHEYPCLKQNGESFRLLKDRHGLVLGAMEEAAYKNYEIDLKPGDTIFLYTDGVTEAASAKNELFGEQRMLDALNYNAEASPAQLLDNVRRAINSFAKGAEQADDITMIALRYYGEEGYPDSE